MNDPENTTNSKVKKPEERQEKTSTKPAAPKEFGGRKGPEPTRYGDWENNGIASDF